MSIFTDYKKMRNEDQKEISLFIFDEDGKENKIHAARDGKVIIEKVTFFSQIWYLEIFIFYSIKKRGSRVYQEDICNLKKVDSYDNKMKGKSNWFYIEDCKQKLYFRCNIMENTIR